MCRIFGIAGFFFSSMVSCALTKPRHIFFTRSPTSVPKDVNFSWEQQNPDSFSVGSFHEAMRALGVTNLTAFANTNLAADIRVGLTFQWEILDCFLAPHSCNVTGIVQGIRNFLVAAERTQVPVQITLDVVQFWYGSGLWNWFDQTQPGYDPANVANVEWTGWTNDTATLISWRNWGSQFRMPTPQPNLASPALLSMLHDRLTVVLGAIRDWYNSVEPSTRDLLVDIKLGEEVDVGANFYFYPNGNALWRASPHNSAFDPTYGTNWSKNLSGGLPALGYNMVKTLGIRSSGGPPTRDEISAGVHHYFESIVKSCLSAWPGLATNGLLSTHAGAVSDPLLLRWDAGMVAPAMPTWSFYLGPDDTVGQPGLQEALSKYDPTYRRIAIGEFFCFPCKSKTDWQAVFNRCFNSPYGNVQYVRVYNLQPFLESPGAVDALRSLTSLNGFSWPIVFV